MLSLLAAAVALSTSNRVIFMQGDSQQLGGSKAWIVNTTTSNATEVSKVPNDFMFSSNGAICGDVYHAIYWRAPDPNDPTKRFYGLAQIDLKDYTFTSKALPDNYYAVWCDPKSTAGDLLLVQSIKSAAEPDPLQATHFYVQRFVAATLEASTIAGPVTAPKNEAIPIAEGDFSFDGNSQVWMSFSLNAFPHVHAGLTAVVDLTANTTKSYFTGVDDGYLVMAQAAASGSSWGVLKRLTRKDTKQTLNFAKIGLDVGSAKVTSTAVNDVSNTANSMGLPAAQCGNVIYTYNTDNFHWFNISGIDATTGAVVWSADTLDLLPGQSFAFTTGFACF